MATEFQPYGFRPVQMRNGSPWCGKTTRVAFASTDATECYTGDFVKYTGTSIADPNNPDIYLPVVTRATASDTRLAGAVVNFDFDVGLNGYISYKRANQAITATVPADSEILYSAQEDGDASFLAVDDTELNVDFVVGTGESATGMSGASIDSSSKATTSTLPLRLVGVEKIPGGQNLVDGTSLYAQWLVTINQDAYTDKAGV